MQNIKEKILIVDDDRDILEFLSYNLKKEGFEVFNSDNGKTAVEIAVKEIPDLILLDVMMPGMDGIETCYQLKEKPELKNTVIAFLTARNEDYSEISGLEAGADDYISKPVRPRVLISRIKALLRRKGKGGDDAGVIETRIKIDNTRYVAIKDNEEIVFPRKEFELLKLLLSEPGKVFLRNEILDKVWGKEVVVGDRTIDVHIRKLREKLGEDYIVTVKGVGYKYQELE
ncbi:MAG: response regulator transcription factor [Bacteroidetes bacterium]|nr:response regulator transcription factor [Bacteroidota bacterium]